MISYLDMTFCSQPCSNEECERNVTQEIRDDAADFGLPLCLGDMKTEDCGFVQDESHCPKAGAGHCQCWVDAEECCLCERGEVECRSQATSGLLPSEY